MALKAYKVDKRQCQRKVGRANPIMGGMAKQYTNAELKAMANYLASVPGDLKVIPRKPLPLSRRIRPAQKSR